MMLDAAEIVFGPFSYEEKSEDVWLVKSVAESGWLRGLRTAF